MVWCLPLAIKHDFVVPLLRSLKPLDVQFMKAIHNKVNVVPVIAKADTLTLKERERLKRRVGAPPQPSEPRPFPRYGLSDTLPVYAIETSHTSLEVTRNVEVRTPINSS